MRMKWYEGWNWGLIGIMVALTAFWMWVISQLVPMVNEVARMYPIAK